MILAKNGTAALTTTTSTICPAVSTSLSSHRTSRGNSVSKQSERGGQNGTKIFISVIRRHFSPHASVCERSIYRLHHTKKKNKDEQKQQQQNRRMKRTSAVAFQSAMNVCCKDFFKSV